MFIFTLNISKMLYQSNLSALICVLCNLCNFHQSVWETESSVPMRLVKTVLLMLSTPFFFFNVVDV